MVSLERVRDELRSMFWLVPAACVAVAIGAAVGLVALDQVLRPVSTGVLFPGPPEGARSFLSSITQAMIAFTGLVFSITIVVLQLTSGQFSPRVLRAFLRDRAIQFALGVFVSTFVYAMVVQRAVTGSAGHDPFVPRIAVTGAFVLVLASVGLFIFYIHHVANMIRVATIVTTLGAESRELLERRYPAGQPAAGPAPGLGPAGRTVAAARAGVLVSVNEAALVRLASQAGCVVELAARVGDFLPQGAPLARIHPDGDQTGPGIDEARLLGEVAQDTERTMEQDLAFGFRQLVNIAERALSPATNDPTTACQALDMLHDLLRRLSVRYLPTGQAHRPGRLAAPDRAPVQLRRARGPGHRRDLALRRGRRPGARPHHGHARRSVRGGPARSPARNPAMGRQNRRRSGPPATLTHTRRRQGKRRSKYIVQRLKGPGWVADGGERRIGGRRDVGHLRLHHRGHELPLDVHHRGTAGHRLGVHLPGPGRSLRRAFCSAARAGRVLAAARPARAFLAAALSSVEKDTRPAEKAPRATRHDLYTLVPALTAVVLGSIGMVNMALALGDRWGISQIVIGTVVLTS